MAPIIILSHFPSAFPLKTSNDLKILSCLPVGTEVDTQRSAQSRRL